MLRIARRVPSRDAVYETLNTAALIRSIQLLLYSIIPDRVGTIPRVEILRSTDLRISTKSEIAVCLDTCPSKLILL